MRIIVVTAMAAGGVIAATIGLAGSGVAAPSAGGTAQDTVNALRAAGYDVIVNRLGEGSLDQCRVTGIRHGKEITERRTVSTDSASRSIDVVVRRPVFVNVKC